MRLGIVRTDLGKGVYLADIESRVQRCFDHEPPGQSRNIRRPTDVELLTPLSQYIILILRGSDGAANVDTTAPANVLKIVRPESGAMVTLTVAHAAAGTAKTDIRDDLNAEFLANGLPYVASLVGNFLQITAITPNIGPGSVLHIDTLAHGSTLNPVVGFLDGFSATGLSLTALKAGVYPTAVTIDVSPANMIATLGAAHSRISAANAALLTNAVANLVAPYLVPTPMVVMSFAKGVISKMRSVAFKPDGLIAGIAAAVLEDDGVTPY